MQDATYHARIERIQAHLAEKQLDGMLVIKPEHVRYVSGFWGYSTRPEYAQPRRLVAVVVPSRGECTLIVPKIERNFALRRTHLKDVRHHVEWTGDEVYGGLELLDTVLKEKGIGEGRLGIEGGFVTVKLLQNLEAALPRAEFVEAADIIERLRLIKSPEEIEIYRKSGRMVVEEFEAEVERIHAGAAEYEIALRGYEKAAELKAAHEAATDNALAMAHPLGDGVQIVTSGERLDMAHALASTRRITDDDVVLLDFCRLPQLHGYRIGFGRCMALRGLTNEERDIADVTDQALNASIEKLRPGVPAEEADIAARELLDREGLLESVVHRTGRGVGLEIAERPEIGIGDRTLLEPGMVVTAEPSVYYPNFAVHVEDTFLITEDGCELITECSRSLTPRK